MTDRDHNQLPNVHGLLADMASGREWPCAGRCGVKVAFPGVCQACDRLALEDAHKARMRAAKRTVPERFRWADIDAPEMAERVRPAAISATRSLFGQRLPLGVAFVGQSGAGKTSLACSILRRIHDRAAFDSPSHVVERARRAWYIGAPQLLQAAKAHAGTFGRGEPPEILKMAPAASILVLDNVDAGKQGDAIYDLIFERHDRQRPTIVTTWMTRDEAAAAYGDGWTRRVYERVIDVSAAPARRLGAA